VVGKNFAPCLIDITEVKGYFVKTLKLHFILTPQPGNRALRDCAEVHSARAGTKQLTRPQIPEM